MKINKYDQTVIVFNHTTYADFYILALYILAYPYQLARAKVLVKPQPFKYAGWLLRKMGCIPSTQVEEKNGGAVPRIVKEMKAAGKAFLLISPKGTIMRHEWRSGYYHIAQQLKAPIMVAGLDYEKKAVITSDYHISYNETEENIRYYLYHNLGNIVSLYPEREDFHTRVHDPKKRSLIDFKHLFKVITITCIIGYLYSNHNCYYSCLQNF